MTKLARLRFAFMALIGVLLTGCEPSKPPVPPSPNPPSMGNTPVKAGVAAAAESPLGIRVDLYHLQLPQGTVSQNEKFWKRLDENAFDPRTYEMLYRNGVRVGQAPISEWDHFHQIMSEHPAVSSQTSLIAAAAKPVELPMRREITFQDIFYFTHDRQMEGRSYESSENLIALTFQGIPRQTNAMRVAMCPIVRSTQKRLEMSPLNNEMEVTYKAPQRLYDLNFVADVAIDHFLVIAPSSEASRSTSIGQNFLVTQGTAERMENVLLIVPRSVRIEAAPTPRTAADRTASN